MKNSESRKGFRGAITSLLVAACVIAASSGAMAANKLIVQDNSVPAVDKFMVTDQGFVGIGTSAPPTKAVYTQGDTFDKTQIISHFVGTPAPGAAGGGGFVGYHNNAGGALPVQGSRLGYFYFGSMNGAVAINAAGVAASAEGPWVMGSPNQTPTFMTFEVAGASGGRVAGAFQFSEA